MALLESILHSFVSLAMLLFEYIGVGVITFAGIQGIVNYVCRKPDTRLVLAKGLAMGLEFKLGSEILRTVVVRNLEEIYIVAGIIALRAILTILIHWEIKNEEREEVLHDDEAVTAENTESSAADMASSDAKADSTAANMASSDAKADSTSADMTVSDAKADSTAADTAVSDASDISSRTE